jgi:hypothetical protein
VGYEEAIDLCLDKLAQAAPQEVLENTIPYKESYAGAKPYWNGACTRVTEASRAGLKAYRYSRDVYTETALRQVERERMLTLREVQDDRISRGAPQGVAKAMRSMAARQLSRTERGTR